MTPERLNEIRNFFAQGQVSYGPCSVSLSGEMARAGAELVAEMDRLEAENARLKRRLGSASLAIHYGVHHGSYESCMADSCRLDREVWRSLDSHPAKR